MNPNKDNIILYLETLAKLEKAHFLFEHLSHKREFDPEETTAFDLEVCQSLLLLLLNNPIFTSCGIDLSQEMPEKEMSSLLMLSQNLKLLLEGLRGDVYEYLENNL